MVLVSSHLRVNSCHVYFHFFSLVGACKCLQTIDSRDLLKCIGYCSFVILFSCRFCFFIFSDHAYHSCTYQQQICSKNSLNNLNPPGFFNAKLSLYFLGGWLFKRTRNLSLSLPASYHQTFKKCLPTMQVDVYLCFECLNRVARFVLQSVSQLSLYRVFCFSLCSI